MAKGKVATCETGLIQAYRQSKIELTDNGRISNFGSAIYPPYQLTIARDVNEVQISGRGAFLTKG